MPGSDQIGAHLSLIHSPGQPTSSCGSCKFETDSHFEGVSGSHDADGPLGLPSRGRTVIVSAHSEHHGGLSVQVAAIPQPGLIFSTKAATRGASLSVREAAELLSKQLNPDRNA